MHWDAQAEPLSASPSMPTHLTQLTRLHANLDMYTERSGHPRTQSTNTHADINAARYTLLHSSSAEKSLFSEHQVLHSSPCAFHHLLGHSAPLAKTKLTFWSQASKLTSPKMYPPPSRARASQPAHPPTPPTPLTRPGKHAGQTCSECAPVMG